MGIVAIQDGSAMVGDPGEELSFLVSGVLQRLELPVVLSSNTVDNHYVGLHHSGILDHLPGRKDSHFKRRKALPWRSQEESLGHPALEVALFHLVGFHPQGNGDCPLGGGLAVCPGNHNDASSAEHRPAIPLSPPRAARASFAPRHSFQSSMRPKGVRRSWKISRYDRTLITAGQPPSVNLGISAGFYPWAVYPVEYSASLHFESRHGRTGISNEVYSDLQTYQYFRKSY